MRTRVLNSRKTNNHEKCIYYIAAHLLQHFYDPRLVRSSEAGRNEVVPTSAADRCYPVQLGIAFFEYCLQVPANRMGFIGNGGQFNLMQLKIIQEVITLAVFIAFSVIAFHMQVKWNHVIACFLMILAVYFVFKG